MTGTPTRWADSELPETLSRVLASADTDAGRDDAALERLRERLDQALGPAFEGSAAGSVASSGMSIAALLARGKWLGVGAILAAGFGVWRSAPPSVPALDAPNQVAAQQLQAQPSAAEPLEGESAGGSPALRVAAPEVDVPNVTAPMPQPKAAWERRPGLARKRANAGPAASSGGLAEELRQLEQIRVQLRTEPARALVAANVHRRRFPKGALGPERELLRIDALLQLGRIGEAQKLAERVLAAPDGHPYRAQIEKLLEPGRTAL